eukprot:TRINITY_DN25811_c0_g1_i1.p1 TRINITY_DN25811_c0_g1~~TRINITY_DN25811_c0_g1_i1.p1  ORF type:complete len:139 (-),score=30.18 TRINITY_DN25811_c0_g1_i1:88-504(-)
MRNRGPGKWREWRWGNTVLPLLPLDPKAEPVDPAVDPSAAKPLSEIAYMTITKLTAVNCQALLVDSITEMAKEPDSPGGRFSEQRLRNIFKEVSLANLSKDEVAEIFPPPEVPSGKPASRKGSKRKTSKEPAAAAAEG